MTRGRWVRTTLSPAALRAVCSRPRKIGFFVPPWLCLACPPPPPKPLSGKLSCRCTHRRAQVSAGVRKPPHGLGVSIWMHLVNGTGNSPPSSNPSLQPVCIALSQAAPAADFITPHAPPVSDCSPTSLADLMNHNPTLCTGAHTLSYPVVLHLCDSPPQSPNSLAKLTPLPWGSGAALC